MDRARFDLALKIILGGAYGVSLVDRPALHACYLTDVPLDEEKQPPAEHAEKFYDDWYVKRAWKKLSKIQGNKPEDFELMLNSFKTAFQTAIVCQFGASVLLQAKLNR